MKTGMMTARLFRARASHRAAPDQLGQKTIQWFALLVLLAQLPHYLHLPWWVSTFGALVILGRFSSHLGRLPVSTWLLNTWVLTLLAALTAGAVRLHYGYFLGRDPCVAFLFLLVSFKFAESRTNQDATLLICLSGFLLLTQYFYAQTIISAVISLPAVLSTGACLLILHNPQPEPNFRDAIRTSARLLLLGAPIAAALFILFPRLPGPLWSLPNDSVATTGLSNSMSPGSISALSLSDAVAFRVEFDGEPPEPEHRYWRGPVLQEFDGRQWTAGSSGFRSAQVEITDGQRFDYTVTLEPHHRQRLFALDLPISLPVRSDSSTEFQIPLARLSSDMQLLTSKPVQRAIRYRQSSIPLSSYQEFAPPLITNTQLVGKNVKTDQFARQMRRRYRNDVEYANAVLRWFNEEEFFYTLKPDLLGDRPVDEFLFDSRQGFCEHFASAFVVMMRAASIPARVVTGYLGGEMNGEYMIIRQSDAHAWTEVWLNNRWVRFDPTAAVSPERIIGLAAALPGSNSVPAMARRDNSLLKRMQLGWDALNHRWRSSVIEFNNDSQRKFWQSLGFSKPKPWQLTIILLCVCAIWCLLILRSHQRKPAELAEDRLWREFCSTLEKAGLPRRPTEGPVNFHLRCQTHWPEHSALLDRIHSNLLTLRFGVPAPSEKTNLLQDTRLALRQLPSRFSLRKK